MPLAKVRQVRSRVAQYSYYCANCGEQLIVGDGLRFCDQCGHRLGEGRVYSLQFGPVVVHQRLIPKKIWKAWGDYVLLDVLGDGGMGRVWRAMHKQSGQHFAIKLVHDNLTLRAGTARRFSQEAAQQRKIVHPNVVRIHDFVENKGVMGIVMELVDGPTLYDEMRSAVGGQMKLDWAIWLGTQMALGLSVVHENGYVHADVKPGNFLMTRDRDRLMIADFGIARDLKAELTGSKKRLRAGTPGFMSPEQIRGDRLDGRSDVYSLGCVLYEMLSGRTVFAGNTAEVLDKGHLRNRPVPLAQIRPGIPSDLDELIEEMLSKSRSDRPESARAVLDGLTMALKRSSS